MEGGREEDGREENKKKSIIAIPSYEEVFDNSQQNPKPNQSLFNPSPSFSQAFSFIKNTEFYTPPPPTPPTPSVPASSPSPSTPNNSSRTIGHSDASPSTSSSVQSGQNRNAILVSHRQKGNPLLKYIRNVRWVFADVVCDYLLGPNSCALYLSVRYHLLHPDYLYFRIRELQKNFKLRVILCHVDVFCSLEECGRYLETIKVYENKPADILQGQTDTDYLSRLSHALTTVRHVNKTDVVTLGSTFGSLSNIMDASMEDLARCPGIGERKVKRLYDTFHEPFKHDVSSLHATTGTEAPSDGNAGSSSSDIIMEPGNGSGVANKLMKKEPSLTVKSALKAAFAKYADKVHAKPPGEKAEEKNSLSVEVKEHTMEPEKMKSISVEEVENRKSDEEVD
ncbi:DNA excision repair protein ERCC-1-like isoform X2 [Papaver somniferum]|uniref:DNA excision repair protein ERCC-1-like isoform X2 n=1 Tax=Papaver somniferum TaxID=3469 RepID=UPI000E6FC649|nr:DNA excision repair protein ERCC-1-like isoform X2 [Papaver somniferum]